MIVTYPRWLKFGILFSAILHDVAVIGMAGAAWRESPPTITIALDHVAGIWVGMLFIGGLFSLIGVFAKNNRIESTGVVMTSAAKLVWVVALLQVHFSPLGAETLVFALMAGAFGTAWRFFGLWVGNYLRAGD